MKFLFASRIWISQPIARPHPDARLLHHPGRPDPHIITHTRPHTNDPTPRLPGVNDATPTIPAAPTILDAIGVTHTSPGRSPEFTAPKSNLSAEGATHARFVLPTGLRSLLSIPSTTKRARPFTRLAFFSLICLLLPHARAAGVSDDDFKALKDLVIQQGKRLNQLEQTHQQDQKTHEQDEQEIQRLKEQLQDTQKAATDAQQKADAASQVQPIHPIPPAPPATHNFTMAGDAEVQFGKVDGSHSAFALADFAPIFLFRAHDNILFEAGLDITLQNTSTPTSPTTSHDSGSTTSIGLSFATLDYLFSDYSTFVGGLMLLPLGTYSERSAGWLNKIPDDPLPRDLVPGNGVGVQLRGAFPVGTPGQAITYSAYVANGPSSSDGTANHDQLDLGGNVGIKSNGTFGNLHGSPAVGGRIGWFKPWKAHYDLELGLSGQTGPWDDAGDHQWSAGVLDAALHIGSNFELKGEYIHTWLDTSDEGMLHPRGWWVQGSYRLAGLNLDVPFLSNIDLVGRYDVKRDSSTNIDTDRYTVGYVYYFSNTLLFEGDYEFLHSNDPEEDHNVLVFQVSYGF